MNGDVKDAAAQLRRRCGFVPDIALADVLTEAVTIPYHELPGLPVSTAPGHRSEMFAGTLSGTRLLALRGRFHCYEGYSMEQIIAPVRLLLTNAAGGVKREFSSRRFHADHRRFVTRCTARQAP